jgi:hypothetical protein
MPLLVLILPVVGTIGIVLAGKSVSNSEIRRIDRCRAKPEPSHTSG